MRRSALLALLILVAGCGGSGSAGEFGDATLAMAGKPSAEDAGIYLATERGYDVAEGVTLRLTHAKDPEFRLVRKPSGRCVAVMAIVRPAKLLLCVDPDTLQEQRDKVKAVVRTLQRGYGQAQLEPDEAVAAMQARLPDLDAAAVSAQMDDVAPTWSAGAPFLGQLSAGPDRDPSIARP